MTTKAYEKVLCVPASAVETMMECGFHADDTLEALLRCKTYRNRHTPNGNDPDVEHDDRWKQLIPYIVCVNSKGQILAYNRGRKGGEKRLASKWAIGFGGHVNDQDETFLLGVIREIREELQVGPIGLFGTPCDNGGWNPLQGPIGFINDDSDDVGRHHLGVVYILRADEVVPMENPEFMWVRDAELLSECEVVESWARLALPMVRAWMESQ